MTENVVSIVEVGPRDGLQNEQVTIPVETKIELVNRLVNAGLKTVEAGAFVSPKWVPQMAASDAVLAGIDRPAGISFPVLVPNMKGFERALAAGVDTISVFGAASETFSQKNINASIAESIERFKPVIEAALTHHIRIRGYISCVAGCPYEGEVALAAVVSMAKTLYRLGCYEISLGDTIGVGTPFRTRDVIKAVTGEVPVEAVAGHFHDTYGRALANIYAALEEGVRTFDSSVSGLGGCPYAKGASGNVATEDVVSLLEKSGLRTSVDLASLLDTSRWISAQLGRQPEGNLARMDASGLRP